MQTTIKPRGSARRTQDVWRHVPSALDAIFAPRTVALIGATEGENSVGRTLLENLLQAREIGASPGVAPAADAARNGLPVPARPFEGTVYPVNPKRATILGQKAYPNIAALPGPVDLAVIVT